MKTIADKRIGVKRLAFIIVLTISTLCMRAGGADKYKKLITKEFGDFTGIYIMGGIIVTGVTIFLISNYFSKKNAKIEMEKQKQHLSSNPQLHSRRGHRRPVKKTS